MQGRSVGSLTLRRIAEGCEETCLDLSVFNPIKRLKLAD